MLALHRWVITPKNPDPKTLSRLSLAEWKAASHGDELRS